MRRAVYRFLVLRRGCCAIAVFALSVPAVASRKPFEHYAPILERRPFGVVVPPPEVAPPPVARPDFARHLKLVALRDGAAGVRVGLLDNGARPPKSYYLPLGAGEDGITIVDVDFEGARALIRKDGREDWISMREGVATEAGPPATVAAAPTVTGREPTVADLSYAERRRQRLEAARSRLRESEPEAPPTPAPDPAELDRQLQEYQMELIRAGRTPLPIPLSEEADAQLVAEGLLPPLSER